jgi:D-alanyl-D-alanine carboxypeptidase
MRSLRPTTTPQEAPAARRRRRRTAAASVSAVAITALLSAGLLASPTPTEAAPRPELQQRMDEIVAAGSPGVAALVDDGDARPWTDARGTADLRTGRPLGPGDRFRAGSVTKSFVATVALQLVDEGRLSLSDTVESRLPGVLPYGDRVTLRQLLNHTSGVPEYAIGLRERVYQGERFRSWAPRELVALIAGEPQRFPSGTAFAYTNTNYVLAGLMIEQATGHRLGHEIARRIFEPLRLRDTSFPVDVPTIAGPSARGYSLDHDEQGEPVEGPLLDLTVYNPSAMWAAGNMVSDLDDLARFYRALLGGRLLSPARLAEMKADGEPWESGQRYGLGLHAIETPCGPIFGHTGGVPGYSTFAFSSEEGTRQVGLMVNAEDAPAAVGGPFDLTVEQAVREAFAGAGRCESGA